MAGSGRADESAQRMLGPGWASPISAYGLIGDCRSAALSSPAGSIDWWCLPRFDGDPVFARVIAGEEGGCFAIAPAAPVASPMRRYRTDSPVLSPVWRVGPARLELTEALVGEMAGRLRPASLLVRRVVALDDAIDVAVRFDP